MKVDIPDDDLFEIKSTSAKLLAKIYFQSDLKIDKHTEMIARPDTLDGLSKGELGGFDVAVRVRMRVP